jgi:hypothetical protein
MKAVFITYNQALTDRVNYLLEQLRVTGWTRFPVVEGKGTNGGAPRLGNHTWPEKNAAILAIVDDPVVPLLLEYIEKLDHVNTENGIRAFVWDITGGY